MRRRLLLARGLVHDPQLILLDEPTVGLDPQIRTELWSLIDELRSARHDDPDVDPLHRGGRAARRRGGGDGARARSSAAASPAELIAEHAGRETAEVYAPPERLAEVRATAEAQGLRGAPGRAGDRDRRLRAGRATAPSPRTRSVRAASLEDVFVLLTGEEAE